MVDRNDLLRLVDVGALGGIGVEWRPHLATLWPIMFEPFPASAEGLDQIARAYPHSTIVRTALANVDGVKSLYVTKNPNCISLLEPNTHLLEDYAIRTHFELTDRQSVNCRRYDSLYQAGEVPTPDAIKIDTQGFEFEVLLGFGSLLQECLAIRLESHFYPLYRDQKMLHDVIGLLDTSGLVLKRIEPKLIGFGGDIVEVEAYFARRGRDISNLSDSQKQKFQLITDVWKF